MIHIKSGPDQPHSVLMGLRMAQMMAEDRDVLVYLDVDGIHAVLQGASDVKMEPFGSSHAMIRDLIARKVPVYACPGCLAALGKKPEQLMPGVQSGPEAGLFQLHHRPNSHAGLLTLMPNGLAAACGGCGLRAWREGAGPTEGGYYCLRPWWMEGA